MDPLGMLAMAGFFFLPGALAAGIAAFLRRRAHPRRFDLDVARGGVRGAVEVVDPRGCEVLGRAPGSPLETARAPGRLRWAGEAFVARDETGRVLEVELSGALAAVHAMTRRDWSLDGRGAAAWPLRSGDVVDLSGRVSVEAPTGGYRASGQGMWRIRASTPGALRITLLARASEA